MILLQELATNIKIGRKNTTSCRLQNAENPVKYLSLVKDKKKDRDRVTHNLSFYRISQNANAITPKIFGCTK